MGIFNKIITLAIVTLVLSPLPILALELSGVSDATYDIEVRSAVGDDCDDDDSNCSPTDRATDSNVCDGVTCSDGSCAATVEECSIAAEALGDPIPDIDITIDQPRLPAATTKSSTNLNDGDSIPTTASNRQLDKATPKLFEALRRDTDTDTDSDGDGIGDVDEAGDGALARAAGFIKFGDIKGEALEDPETGERRLSQIAIAARDIRNWTTEDREASVSLRESVASTTPEAASLRIVDQMLTDVQIEEIIVTETEAQVRYRTSLRLFGLIPLEREVEARVQAGGEVKIHYPWYSFLATKPDTERIRNIFNLLIESAVIGGGGGAGKVRF